MVKKNDSHEGNDNPTTFIKYNFLRCDRGEDGMVVFRNGREVDKEKKIKFY